MGPFIACRRRISVSGQYDFGARSEIVAEYEIDRRLPIMFPTFLFRYVDPLERNSPRPCERGECLGQFDKIPRYAFRLRTHDRGQEIELLGPMYRQKFPDPAFTIIVHAAPLFIVKLAN